MAKLATRSEKLVASGPNPVALATPQVATSSPDLSLSQEYCISRASHKLSQASIYGLELGVVYTGLKLKELLYSQKYSHRIRVFHYCCLLLAANMGTTVEQYWLRIGCHNNSLSFFTCAKLMCYLNVFYLPTLKDVVVHYKLWNEVMVWFTQMVCYNVYIPLLIRQANNGGGGGNPGPTILILI